MRSDDFLTNFSDITNAPDGVKYLREVIRQLAVTGKLVTFDRDEVDESSILDEMENARIALVSSGEMKTSSILSDVEDDEKTVSVPSNWVWCRLGNLTSKIGSGSTPRGGKNAYVYEGIPFLRSQNVWNEGLNLSDVAYINESTHEQMRNTHVEPNDVLLNITGASLGRCALVPHDLSAANVSQHVTIIRPLIPENRRFLQLCLLAPFGQAMIWGRQVGMAREGLSKKVLELFEIPLPPLSEQKRIVAKVDELMKLCDALERQQQQRSRLLPLLSKASHARLAETPTPANLAAIFTDPPTLSPEDMRKTILSLAVRGKLGESAFTDQAAESFLEDTDAFRREIAKSDRRVKSNREALLSMDKRWGIPVNWSWAAVADLVLFVDYRGKTPTKVSSGVRLVTAKNVRKWKIQLLPEEFISELDYDKWMTRGLPKVGDILFTTEAPMGFAAVIDITERFALAQRVICFQPFGEFNPHFAVLQLLSEEFQTILRSNATGVTAQGIKAAKLRRLPFAVPPLDEQTRIVSMVHDLFSIVDKLEKLQHERIHISEEFARASVAAITGTRTNEQQNMKAPKTELVTRLISERKPTKADNVPLTAILSKAKTDVSAEELWQKSGLEIDAFYSQLKLEMSQGWIVEPTKGTMQEVVSN